MMSLRTRRGGGGRCGGWGRLRRPRAPLPGLLTSPGRPKGPIPTSHPLPPLRVRSILHLTRPARESEDRCDRPRSL